MKTFKEIYELLKTPDQDLKQLIDDLLEGCQTTETVLERFNSFTMDIANFTLFKWENHNGKRVLMADISQGDENIWGSRQAVFGAYFLVKLYGTISKDQPLLVTFNMSNLAVNKELLGIAKNVINTTNLFETHKVAMYGLSTIKKMVIKVFVTEGIKIVDTKEDAIEWVTA